MRAEPRRARRGPRRQDRQLGARRRRHLQLRQGRRGRQAHRPADRVRRRLQEALRRPRQRARPGTTAPTATPAARTRTRRWPTSPATSATSTARTIKRLYHGAVGRDPRRLRVRRRRPRRRAGAAPSSAATPLYWGESLFLGGHLHSVAYAQNPLDLQKGFATPGTEAKELFRPLNQLSVQAAGDRHAVAGRRSTCSSGSRPATPKAAPTSARSTSCSTARTASSCSPARSASPTRGDGRRAASQQRRVRPVGALEPRVARRHGGLLLPQLRRQAAADAAHQAAAGQRQPATT